MGGKLRRHAALFGFGLMMQAATASAVLAQTDPLVTVLASDTVANGVATTPDGRIFLPFSRIDRSVGPQVVEWKDNKPRPFPDAAWNDWAAGKDPTRTFVRVNALRIGPEGALWVVDTGAPGLGLPKVPHGPKVVKIDVSSARVLRTYDLDSVTSERSFIDDIRFHGSLGYVTDAGWPGVIIIDLVSGAARRVLDGDLSVTAQRPLSADAHVLRGPDGKPVKIHADQLEVSPDGRFFYYQPASGPMSRIATRYLDDPKLTNAQLAKHVTTFAKTPSTGGTAIDAQGNIYCSDINRHQILKIAPDGSITTIISDPRLLWVDAMWVDDDGYLFMPAAQLDRMAPFNGGVSKVQYPIYVYKMKIGIKPPSSDHP
jgi:sugar lactone lactonase YvrE